MNNGQDNTGRDARFIVFRPKGGLNDSLNQLERCWRHAETFNRRLIVDTRGDTLTDAVLALFRHREARARVSPKTGQIATHQPIWLRTGVTENAARFDIDESGTVSVVENVDLSIDHAEDVIIHQQAGGGFDSWNCLHRITVREEIRPMILSFMPELPAKYDAVHIRGTDYSPLTTPLIDTLNRSQSNTALLVCSDSNDILHDMPQLLPRTKTITFADHDITTDQPLHSAGAFAESTARDQAAIRLLAEISALSNARRFYFGTVMSPYVEGKQHVSGFSNLILYLVAHRAVARRVFGTSLIRRGLKSFLRGRLVADNYSPTMYWWGVRKNSATQTLARVARRLGLR